MKSKIIYFLRKALKLNVFESIVKETSNFKYLTAEHMAKLEGISVEHARKKLNAAVNDGFLEKRYLFTDVDLEINILVEKNQIGKKIYIDDLPETFESKEIFIAPQFTKEIYIAH
jgi:hypothetical protein